MARISAVDVRLSTRLVKRSNSPGLIGRYRMSTDVPSRSCLVGDPATIASTAQRAGRHAAIFSIVGTSAPVTSATINKCGAFAATSGAAKISDGASASEVNDLTRQPNRTRRRSMHPRSPGLGLINQAIAPAASGSRFRSTGSLAATERSSEMIKPSVSAFTRTTLPPVAGQFPSDRAPLLRGSRLLPDRAWSCKRSETLPMPAASIAPVPAAWMVNSVRPACGTFTAAQNMTNPLSKQSSNPNRIR